MRGVLGHAKRFIRRDTLIVIDPSDIQKPYAKKMPYLAKVWDGSRGIYVYDRGGDRNEIFRYFIEHGLAFIVRMMRKRYLVHNGERVNILVLAAMCHTPHRSEVEFNAQGEDKPTKISYGAIPVRLPEDPGHPGMHEKDLRLVVVRGFGQTAMLILTSIPGDGSKGDVWRIVHGYLTRECAERSEGRSRSDGEAARQGPRASRRRFGS